MSKDWLKVLIYAPVRNDIHKWPLRAKKDFGSILTKLQKGEVVGYPDVKPMPDLASGASEIRMRDITGNYRIFYIIKSDFGILIFHSFKKKTRKTPMLEIKTGKRRLRDFLREMNI